MAAKTPVTGKIFVPGSNVTSYGTFLPTTAITAGRAS
jgi:hypothetical protein